MKTFSIKEALSTGWELVKNNFWFVVGTTLVYSILNFNMDFSSDEDWGMPSFDTTTLVIIALLVLVSLAFWAVSIVVQIGYYRIYLKLLDGKERPKFRELFAHSHPFWRYIGIMILYCLRILLGFILLIVPGIVWAIKFQFAPVLTVDKGLKPLEAMAESARMTEGHKWELFKFGAVVIAVNLLGILCLVVGILVTIPLTTIAYLSIYRKLSGDTSSSTQVL